MTAVQRTELTGGNRSMQPQSAKFTFTMLSNREREVLLLIAEDKTDREIAHDLGISERTVRAHVSRIILKLGVSSRVGAAVVAAKWTVRTEFHPLA